MADAAPAKKNYFKVVLGSFLGLCAGAGTMYFNAIFNTVVRPPKPVANFSIAAVEGLTATFANKASGTSGWWDFGDGSALEPFDPDQATVTHTYTKPGSFKVKLIVRNFLLDENGRDISLDLIGTPAAVNLNPPKLIDLQLEKISETVPATYLVRGEVQNADEIIWAVGEQREHVTAAPGKFEKYLRIDKAGQIPIVVTALSKTKATPDMKIFPVTTTNPKTSVFDVRLDVRDTISRTDTVIRTEMLPVPFKDPQGKFAPQFSRTISAAGNCTIKNAQFDTRRAQHANAIRNIKTTVSADGKQVTVTGEWAHNSAETMVRAVGGGELFIPVTVTEDRVISYSPGRSAPAFVLNPVSSNQWQGGMALPAVNGQVQRTINVIIGITQQDGTRTELARGVLDPSNGWAGSLKAPANAFNARATVVNGEVQVAIGQFPLPLTASSAGTPTASPTVSTSSPKPSSANPAPAPTSPDKTKASAPAPVNTPKPTLAAPASLTPAKAGNPIPQPTNSGPVPLKK